MNTRKVLVVILIIFVIFFVIQSPADAADITHSLSHGVVHIFDGLSTFLRNLN